MLAPALFAQSAIGHVLDIKGDWYLYSGGADSNKAQKLSRWQDVPSGGVIRIKDPSTEDHISIVDIHLNLLVARSVQARTLLPAHLFAPRSKRRRSYRKTEFVVTGAWNLLWGEPYQPSMYRTRGATPILDEGIAPIDHDTVDLRELMQHMHKGKYSLVPYQPQLSEGSRAAAISFDWNPDVGSVISIGNWTPGLTK